MIIVSYKLSNYVDVFIIKGKIWNEVTQQPPLWLINESKRKSNDRIRESIPH